MNQLCDLVLFPHLVIVDLAAKVHPAHVLHKDIQSVPLLSCDIGHQFSVSLQQALVNLPTQVFTSHHEL